MVNEVPLGIMVGGSLLEMERFEVWRDRLVLCGIVRIDFGREVYRRVWCYGIGVSGRG